MAVCSGLLASSCCIVQLVLNFFSIGCAGFNTMLQPYRPIILSLVFGGLTYSFIKDFLLASSSDICNKKSNGGENRVPCDYQKLKKKRFAITATIAILLSFSPEILWAINSSPSVLLAPLHRLHLHGHPAVSFKSCHLTAGDPKTIIFILVEGMHCEACVNNAINALLALNSCAKIDLVMSGEGSIALHADDAHALTDRLIEEAIARATFKAHVLRRESSTELN